MAIKYDWRNLAVEFRFYSNVPPATEFGVEDVFELEKFTAYNTAVVSRVKMLYDAGGNRVLKQEFR